MGLLDTIQEFGRDSISVRHVMEQTWADGLYRLQGTWTNWQKEENKLIGEDKTKFRFVGSILKQIQAAIYTAYLKDKKTVEVVPSSDMKEDEMYASVCDQVMGTYTNYLRQYDGLSAQHQNALENVFTHGYALGRLRMPFGRRGLSYEVIPPERTLIDWRLPSIEKSEIIILEHYLNPGEWAEFCEATGYADDGTVIPQIPQHSLLRDARMNMPTQYLSVIPELVVNRPAYVVWECYVRMGSDWGVVYTDNLCQRLLSNYIPVPFLPIIAGYAYYVAHRLVGDTITSWGADAEDAANRLCNARRENVIMKINAPILYPTGLNLDLKTILKDGLKAGQLLFVDDPNSVRFLEIPDATQSAFMELSYLEGILNNLAGLPSQQIGTSGTPGETVSQIYETQAKKLDLLCGTFSETYWEPFHRMLVRMLCYYGPDHLFERAIRSVYSGEMIVVDAPSREEFREFDPLRANFFVAHTNYSSQERAKTLVEMASQLSTMNNVTLQLHQQQLLPRDQITIYDPTIMLSKAMNEMGLRGVEAFRVSPQAQQQAQQEAQQQAQEQAQQAPPAQGQEPQAGQYQQGDEEFIRETTSPQPDGSVVKEKHIKKIKQGTSIEPPGFVRGNY